MIEAKSASSSANEVSMSTLRGRMLGPDLPGRLDPAPVGEPDVHDHHVGLGAVGLVDRLPDRSCLGAYDGCPLRAASIDRMPSRTTSWSSTSITRRGGRFGSAITRC